jgi:glycosyltransferase involved in cell wall biosynthesis
MKCKTPNVLFIHSAWPNQFSLLHAYFQESGLAHSLFLTSEQCRSQHQYGETFPNGVLSYVPDGDQGPHSYYYSGIVERNARHALNILRACRATLDNHPIDIIVAHGILGAPHMLFGEVDVPIATYVEFPSFRHHGWDLRYPPQDAQRYCDKYEEMLNYQAAIRSDLVITPSEHARNMFPTELRGNVTVRMEGFDPRKLGINDPDKAAFEKQPGFVYAGFAASVLSSAKGFEQFILISKRLSAVNPDIRYVVMGAEEGANYGFEKNFLDQMNGQPSFRDYVLTKYGVDTELYLFTGRLDEYAFSATIRAVDFFIYPLQFGSANWGLYELLLRGKPVVASNRCFLPEVITHGENGLLVDFDDIEGWVNACNRIALHPSDYTAIGNKAALDGRKYYIENVAEEYLRTLCKVIGRSRHL